MKLRIFKHLRVASGRSSLCRGVSCGSLRTDPNGNELCSEGIVLQLLILFQKPHNKAFSPQINKKQTSFSCFLGTELLLYKEVGSCKNPLGVLSVLALSDVDISRMPTFSRFITFNFLVLRIITFDNSF